MLWDRSPQAPKQQQTRNATSWYILATPGIAVSKNKYFCAKDALCGRFPPVSDTEGARR